ncbi:hypothetical protein [Micromonospora sp. HUAS LYJ1]|nr:hypothetical protein [Micromonospora sp. HUAS LYJ1]WKU08049.1 hypothetical protein Q2K16_13965 [Micromonospora sp. HUAS LYJ1]
MSRPAGPSERDVAWHHGTPDVGAPPAPLFAAADVARGADAGSCPTR